MTNYIGPYSLNLIPNRLDLLLTEDILNEADSLFGPDRVIRKWNAPFCEFSGAAHLAAAAQFENLAKASLRNPIWIEGTSAAGEPVQLFGRITNLELKERWPNRKLYTFDFKELAAWGRLALCGVPSDQLNACDSLKGWLARVAVGNFAQSLSTSVYAEGTGSIKGTATAVANNDVGHIFTLTTARDLSQKQGLKFRLRLSSLSNISALRIWCDSIAADFSNYYAKTLLLPGATGAFYEYGVLKEMFSVGAGSPAWSSITRVMIGILGNATGWAGDLYVDDIWLVGDSHQMKIYDLDYANGYADILSPIWARHAWSLTRS